MAALGLTAKPAEAKPPSRKAAPQAKLRAQMADIAAITRGPVGAAVAIVEGGSIIALHGEQRFPMQSTYKLPIAMAVLHQVDVGKINLNQQVRITKAESRDRKNRTGRLGLPNRLGKQPAAQSATMTLNGTVCGIRKNRDAL